MLLLFQFICTSIGLLGLSFLAHDYYLETKKKHTWLGLLSVFLVLISVMFGGMALRRTFGLLALWDKKHDIVQPWELPGHSFVTPMYKGELND